MNQKKKITCKSCKRIQWVYFENVIQLPEPLKLEVNSNEFIFTKQNMVDYFNNIINKALLETKESFDIEHVHYNFMIIWITKIVDKLNSCGVDPLVFTIFLLEYMMKWSWVRQMQTYQNETGELTNEQNQFIDFIAQGLFDFTHTNNIPIEKGELKLRRIE